MNTIVKEGLDHYFKNAKIVFAIAIALLVIITIIGLLPDDSKVFSAKDGYYKMSDCSFSEDRSEIEIIPSGNGPSVNVFIRDTTKKKVSLKEKLSRDVVLDYRSHLAERMRFALSSKTGLSRRNTMLILVNDGEVKGVQHASFANSIRYEYLTCRNFVNLQ